MVYNELSQTQECGATNQVAQFAIKLLLLYIRVLLALVLNQHRRSTDLLEKCVRQRRQNNCRTDGKQNEDSP